MNVTINQTYADNDVNITQYPNPSVTATLLDADGSGVENKTIKFIFEYQGVNEQPAGEAVGFTTSQVLTDASGRATTEFQDGGYDGIVNISALISESTWIPDENSTYPPIQQITVLPLDALVSNILVTTNGDQIMDILQDDHQSVKKHHNN